MKSHLNAQLPQQFAWVRDVTSGESAIRTLDSMGARRVEYPTRDVHRSEIEANTLAVIRNLPRASHDSMRVIRFENVEVIPGSKKYCSGFQVVDEKALRTGNGGAASIVTVLYIPDREQGGREYPLAIPHAGRRSDGIAVRSELDRWSKARFGTTAGEFIAKHSPAAPMAKSSAESSISPSSSGGDIAEGFAVAADVASTAAEVALSDTVSDGIGSLFEGLGELLSGLGDIF